ncbi:serine hydrolase [Pelomonas sp. KK5]|uniref:serine hydrolase domain-containing protein n=1 Tax=Pelomonas sp. KK5 TaxID=1855730 RepID=UPI00097BACEA|nr:serine hydrolase domain-containing protein [Pelomonas sp. KK5]
MSASPIADDLSAQLDGLFEPARRSDAPGLIVGVALNGRAVYRRAFGMASVQHGVANRPQTRIRIASISKHFTCLAALLLAEDGLLDLDAPVTRYLSGVRSRRGVPTLRQFMTHTSGYRCTLDMGTLANGTAVQPNEWQLAALLRQGEANFAPGEGQIYSNGTYHALSLVIEQVAGMPFERFLKTRIFEPLGMQDTDSIPNDALMVPGLASPHVPAPEGGWMRPPSDADLRGDGGMVSTVDDMLRWLAHLRGSDKRVGTAETWRQMLEPATLANGLQSTYALGLKRHAYRGHEIIHHSGGLFGLNGQMLTVPGLGLDLVVLVNGAPLSATNLGWRIVDAVLGDAPGSAPAPVLASIAGLEHLAGARYQAESGLLIGFDEVQGKLGVSLFHMPPIPLLFDQGDQLRAGFESIGLGPYVLARKDLAPENGQAPRALRIEVGGTVESMRRLDAAEVLDRSALVGRYWCEDLQASAEIHADAPDVLRMQGDYSAARGLAITALGGSTFGLEEQQSPGTRYPLTAQVERNQVTGFRIDTYRARRLWFVRRTGA